MKITVYTERGTFTSKMIDATEEDREQIKDLIKQCAVEGNYFILDTETGYVVLGKELLSTAAFAVDEVQPKGSV
jgi:hypothetical protein